LPDEFYTTLEETVSFDRRDFDQYRIRMDAGGSWVRRICEIVQNTPRPRADHPRPARHIEDALEDDLEISSGQDQALDPADITYTPARLSHWAEYYELSEYAHRQFFMGVMLGCAQRLVEQNKTPKT